MGTFTGALLKTAFASILAALPLAESVAQQTPIPLPYTCDSSPPPDLAKGDQTFFAGTSRAPSAGADAAFRIVWGLTCGNRIPGGQLTITPRLNEQLAGLASIAVVNIDQFIVYGKGTPELFLSASCQATGHINPMPCRLWLLLARRAANFDYVASFLVLGENGATLAYGTGVAPYPKKTSAKSRILYDQRNAATSSRAVPETLWRELTLALTNLGLAVSYHTHANGRLTAAALQATDLVVVRPFEYAYDAAEKQALLDFVNQGGAMLVAGEFGPSIGSASTIDLLSYFGATYEDNTIHDAAHSVSGYTSWVVYADGRSFLPHPIMSGLTKVQSAAGSSLSGTQWQKIIETDDDATPARRPVAIVREMGGGRLLALGDTNVWSDDDIYGAKISVPDNRRFGLRSFTWLLFRPLNGI